MAITFEEIITALSCREFEKNALRSSELFQRVKSSSIPRSLWADIQKLMVGVRLEDDELSSLKRSIEDTADPDARFLTVVILMSLIHPQKAQKEVQFQLCELVGQFPEITAKILTKDTERGIINYIGNQEIVEKIPRALSDYGKSISMSASTFLKIMGAKRVESPYAVKTKETRLFTQDELVKKQAKGQSDSKIIKVSREGKKFFMRVLGATSQKHDSSEVPTADNLSVFASKLARVISEKHFASEHMLSEGHTVSRLHEHYVVPFTDSLSRKKIGELQKKGTIPGSGIIDEVCAFIGETDPNAENIGFSDARFDDKTFISKIDFDRCKPFDEDYDPDSRMPYTSINTCDVWSDDDYLTERISARFKVALLSKECIESLMLKHLGTLDKVDVILAKSGAALSAISTNDKVKDYLKKIGPEATKELLEQAKLELIDYFSRHFKGESLALILNSLEDRLTTVAEEINSQILNSSIRPD